jgi:hypothetical protein
MDVQSQRPEGRGVGQSHSFGVVEQIKFKAVLH